MRNWQVYRNATLHFPFNQRSIRTCNPLGLYDAMHAHEIGNIQSFGARFVYFGDHKLHINNVMFKSRLSSLFGAIQTRYTIRHRDLDGEQRNNNFNTLTWVLDRLKYPYPSRCCVSKRCSFVVRSLNRFFLCVAHSHRLNRIKQRDHCVWTWARTWGICIAPRRNENEYKVHNTQNHIRCKETYNINNNVNNEKQTSLPCCAFERALHQVFGTILWFSVRSDRDAINHFVNESRT